MLNFRTLFFRTLLLFFGFHLGSHFLMAPDALGQTPCPRVYLRQDTLWTDPAPAYQWYLDDEPIPAPEGQQPFIIPETDGTYTVEVSDTSEAFEYLTPVIRGWVLNEDLEPVALSQITYAEDNIEILTEGDARFEFRPPTVTDRYTLTFSHPDYFTTYQSILPVEADTVEVRVIMTRKPEPLLFEAGEGGQFHNPWLHLTIPPNALMYPETGEPYDGTVRLYMAYNNPSDPFYGLNRPGGDLLGLLPVQGDFAIQAMKSFGHGKFLLEDTTGQRLDLIPEEDKGADIDYLIELDEVSAAPDELAYTFYDPEYTEWVAEATGRKYDNRFQTKARHFSYWSCDQNYEVGLVAGQVLDCNGNLQSGVVVKANHARAVTDSDGIYLIPVALNEPLTLTTNMDTLTGLTVSDPREPYIVQRPLIGSPVLARVRQRAGFIQIQTASERGEVTLRGEAGGSPFSVEPAFRNEYGDDLQILVEDAEGCVQTIRPAGPDFRRRPACRELPFEVWAQMPRYEEIGVAINTQEPVYRLLQVRRQLARADLIQMARDLPCLHGIRFIQCRLDSGLPDEIGRCSNLRRLSFLETELGTVPEAIGNLYRLEELQFQDAGLDTLPASLVYLDHVYELDVSDNNLRTFPEQVFGMDRLRLLNIKDNQLSDIPERIRELNGQLAVLDIRGNPDLPADLIETLRYEWLPEATILAD